MFERFQKGIMFSVALALLLAAVGVGSIVIAAPDNSQIPAANPLHRAYIANTGGSGNVPSINVIDMDNMSLIDTFRFNSLAGKAQQHYISVSPDGKYIWIGEDTSATGGFVQVVDAASGQYIKKWDVGSGVGNHMTRDRKANGRDGDGSTRKPNQHHYVFSTSAKTNSIHVFDVEDQTYLGEIPVGAAPHVIDTSPDGNTLWTTNASGGKVLRYDISGLPDTLPAAPSAEVNIGGSLHALLVHPNGKYVFVGSSLGGVNVIDTATNTVVATKAGGIATAHNYEISPDGNHLLVGESGAVTCDTEVDPGIAHDGSRGPFLWFLNVSTLNTFAPDMSTLKVDKWFESSPAAPIGPSHEIYTPDGKHIMLTGNSVGQGMLFVLNADTLKLERMITVADSPHGIAYPGDNR